MNTSEVEKNILNLQDRVHTLEVAPQPENINNNGHTVRMLIIWVAIITIFTITRRT